HLDQKALLARLHVRLDRAVCEPEPWRGPRLVQDVDDSRGYEEPGSADSSQHADCIALRRLARARRKPRYPAREHLPAANGRARGLEVVRAAADRSAPPNRRVSGRMDAPGRTNLGIGERSPGCLYEEGLDFLPGRPTKAREHRSLATSVA